MYTDLRMFDQANEYLDSAEDSSERKMLIKKKADWAAKINEPRAAAEMYLSAGETRQAIHLIGEHGWVDMLNDVGRKLDKADTENVRLVAHYLKKHKQLQYARDMYKKVGDFKAVVLIYVDAGEWKEAFSLVDKNPEYREHVRAGSIMFGNDKGKQRGVNPFRSTSLTQNIWPSKTASSTLRRRSTRPGAPTRPSAC